MAPKRDGCPQRDKEFRLGWLSAALLYGLARGPQLRQNGLIVHTIDRAVNRHDLNHYLFIILI